MVFVAATKMFDFEARILEIRDYVDEGKLQVRVLRFSTEKAPDFDFKPGQFVMIYTDSVKSLNNPEKPKLSSMSICSAPHQKSFVELCIRMHDKPGPSVSRFIGENAKAGDTLHLKGPFGVFGMVENQKTVGFVGTGTGIAPLMGMLRHLIFTKFKGKIVFFYGCRNKNDFLYGDELVAAEKSNPNLELQVIFSRESFRGKQGYVQELLKEYKFPQDNKSMHFYLCGNPAAVQEEKEVLASLGFSEEQVHDERW